MTTPRPCPRIICVLAVIAAAAASGCAKRGDSMVINPNEGTDTRRFEYRTVRLGDQAPNPPVSADNLEEARQAAIKDLKPQGWQYVGTEVSDRKGKPTMLLFRRPLP